MIRFRRPIRMSTPAGDLSFAVGSMVVNSMLLFVDPPAEALALGDPREAHCELEFEALGQAWKIVLTTEGIAL